MKNCSENKTRILAIEKETGQPVPLIQGARLVLLTEEACPWKYAEIELNFTQSYSNPHLICPNPTLMMFSAEDPVRVELQQEGVVRNVSFGDQEISLIPNGDVGRWISPDPHQLLLVSINSSLFVDIALDAGLSESNQLPFAFPLEDEFVKSALQALRKESESGFSSGQMYGDSISTAIAAHLLSRYRLNKGKSIEPRGGLGAKTLQAVTDWLKENYYRDISLDELSALAHLSPYHFSRLFKSSTGMTPHKYLLHIRVKKAKELLAEGRMNSKQIAKEVGFWDVSHMSRHLRRVYNVSLSDIREGSPGRDSPGPFEP